MSVLNPTKFHTTPEHALSRFHLSVAVWRGGVWAGLALFAAVLAGLLWFGMDPIPAGLWALTFGTLTALRVDMGRSLGLLLSRLCFALGPLVSYSMVEQMNWNQPWSSFSKLQVALNLAWYYLIACGLYLLLGRRNLSAGTALTLCFAIGMANRYVIRFRGRTIFPGDLLTLRTAANVAGNYDYRLDATQLQCLLVLALCLLVLWKLPRQQGRSLPRLWITLPAVGVAAAYLAVFFGTGFLSALEIEPSMWTTRGNGFLLNFSVCLRYSRVSEPEGYSQEALDGLTEGYAAGAAAQGTRPENLIVIMNESFSDLSVLGEVPVSEDFLPFFRSLSENTVRGTAYASVFGGTTANSEYEFLTGNTTAFLPEGTVPFHLYVADGTPNLGAQMKDLGYDTVFLHPYLASGWNRRAVYADFGFDTVLFQDDLTDTSLIREYISDQSDYESLIRLYEEKEEGQPLFLFNVTMQNHSGYDKPWDGLERTAELTGVLAGRFPTVDQYLSLIKQSDNAFRYLINYFSQVEEPTMILLFGDHQPQVATSFYTKMLGGSEDTWDAATAQKRQAVPFVIWANYDIPEAQGVELSLNYLSALLAETANLPQTGYQQFLNELRQTVPVVNAVGFRDTDGTWVRRRSQLSAGAQAALKEYEMLQYNVIFDKTDATADFFTLPTREEAG
ncbi:LTA synthase family protein [Intestinimonas sp. UBA1698]|uniref:LTA synthase family protein n=1 Tax=Intestinimonas sp. UBA1698 TaxID=1946651 RepID=UPI00257B5A00|nr:LTA synthase family protein [Intestinimonas sp. UBA1698]